MSAVPFPTPTTSTSHDPSERLELVRDLFHEFHSRCFWHCPRDLAITEDLIPFVAKALRTYGGRRGFVLAGKLQSNGSSLPSTERDLLECR